MNTPEQLSAALKAVFAKAATDADFRAKCLADPAAAARELGAELPAGITFAEAPCAAAVVLPPFGSDPDEITDAEALSDVAGGNLGPENGDMTHPIYGGPGCGTP